MITPFDWQEGLGNRASFVEGRLAQGGPVLALSLDAGILAFTYRRMTPKLHEVYDRLLFGAIGQQSDVEALRVATLEFCSREGYARSEKDVTIGRVATALSGPIKRAFGDFAASPLVARLLLAEVGDTPDRDAYYIVDYDGDYVPSRDHAVLAGTSEVRESLAEEVKNLSRSSLEDALAALPAIWDRHFAEGTDIEAAKADLKPEAMLVERASHREDRFRILYPEEF